MKTFLTLTAATILAVAGLHAWTDVKIWNASMDLYREQIKADQGKIHDLANAAPPTGKPGPAPDPHQFDAAANRLGENVRAAVDLLHHKPYGLALTMEETGLLNEAAQLEEKLKAPGGVRPAVAAPASAAPLAPSAPARANNSQIAADIERRYGGKTNR